MQVRIEKQDYEGRGVTHMDGKVVFVPRMLPEEVGNIHIEKEEKNYSIGKLDTLLEKSDMRIPSFCPYAKVCGGCVYDFVSSTNSLFLKKEMVKDLMHQKGISLEEFSIVPSRPVLGYRNKGVFHVEDGHFGFYEEESHHLIEIRKCELMHPKINEVLLCFQDFSFLNGTFTVRVSEKGEILLSIETEDQIKIKENFVKKFPIKGILLNHKCVYGEPYFLEEQDDIKYLVHADAFFQVNPYIAKKIKEEVLNHVNKDDIVFDLYCGCGFFTFPIARIAKKVYGVEISPASILNAEKMKNENHGENISFHVGKVEKILPNINEDSSFILVDPPRSGLDIAAIEYFLQKRIPKIIYISCNPMTLARDLQKLTSHYQISFFQCFDMFPFTKHVECMCVLNKNSI